MPASTGRGILPWLSLLTVWIVWSSTYIGMSAAVETIPPFLMSAGRFLLASSILLTLAIPAWRKGDISVTWPEIRSVMILGVVMLVGGPALVGYAETELDSSLAALIVALTPIWMAVFTAIQTRTKPRPGIFGALFVGVAGIAVMVGAPGGDVPVIPALLVFISTWFWAGGTVMGRFLPLPKHPLVSSGMQMLFGGTALVMVSGTRGEFAEFALANVSGRSWFGLSWLVIAGSVVAFSAYLYANATLPIEIVSTYAYINPVLAVALGATLDDDVIGPNVLIGGTIIVLAVVFIVSGHVVRRRPPAPEDDLLGADPIKTRGAVANTDVK